MMINKYTIFMVLAYWLVLSPCYSQLQPASIFTDNMVLQRNQPIIIWGKSLPGQMVDVVLGSLNSKTITQKDSSWLITFPGLNASKVPVQIKISSFNQEVVLKNILIGDIWLCIGQSNMEWPMVKEMHYQNEIKDSHQPLLRFYNPTYAGKYIFGTSFNDSINQMLIPSAFFKGIWKSCDSLSISDMSAVAYYFGKNIIKKTDIPIGLIHMGIGGAPLETFIDPMAIKHHKRFSSKMNGNWMENNHLPFWIRERAIQNVGISSTIPCDQYGKNHAFKPGFVFTSGILPLKNLPVKGVLCYQGESNAQEKERVNEYSDLFKLLVDTYRSHWNNVSLPVYFTQLSSIDTIAYKGYLWPKFRDEQRKIVNKIPHTGMAVTSDAGDRNDVHPRNKKIVGERLSFWALSQTYGYDIKYSGPTPLDAQFKKNTVIITFKKGEKLQHYPNNSVLHGFSFDGILEKSAEIIGNRIFIKTAQKPELVYYGWSPYSSGNLYNSSLIPASTFKLFVK